jgi:hypothetical protein
MRTDALLKGVGATLRLSTMPEHTFRALVSAWPGTAPAEQQERETASILQPWDFRVGELTRIQSNRGVPLATQGGETARVCDKCDFGIKLGQRPPWPP